MLEKKQYCLAFFSSDIGDKNEHWQVPADVESTRAAVEQICPLKKTFYGEAWAMEANMEYADTAYSKERLGAHTDTTYFSQACR